MKTCKTCKYWRRNKLIQSVHGLNYPGRYDKPNYDSKFGECVYGCIIYSGGKDANKDETRPSDAIMYGDKENDKTRLLTGQNFGCIHYIFNYC